MERVERFLKDAQSAYNMELYTVTITVCDRTMQLLLTTMLEHFGIDVDSKQNQLLRLLDTLKANAIQLESEHGLWWLSNVLEQIREEGKQVTLGMAKEAIRVTRKFFTEVTALLGIRP